MEKKIELDDFQKEAIEYIDNNYNLLICAPTGSGKTLIAEYAINKNLKNIEINNKEINKKNKIYYTCPIKSLCNEKYNDFSKKYKNTDIIIGLSTGDININPNADIIIMTTEVLYNLLINHDDKNKENKISCIIYDEAHYINDDTRGHIWEKCIIMSLINHDALIILLSATIGNTEEIIEWLNSIKENKIFKKIVKMERPVPLREYLYSDRTLELNEENYRRVKKYYEKQYEDGITVSSELNKLINNINSDETLGTPAIIFVISKNKCIEYAECIGNKFINKKEAEEIIDYYEYNLKEYMECEQYKHLRKIIIKGVAYHHSGLIPKIREVIEILMKAKLIKIVFATETFAVGLNFPVKTTVLTSLTKPTNNSFRELYVSEYKQMAGRAGRRFLDTYGNCIIWLYPCVYTRNKKVFIEWQKINNIVNGRMENIISKYVIDPIYIIKNIKESSKYREITEKSLRYYRSDKRIKEKKIEIPEKFRELYDLEEYMNSIKNIKLIDKNYNRIYNGLNKKDKEEYKNMKENIENMKKNKSDYEYYIDYEENMIEFLLKYNFIEINYENNNNNNNKNYKLSKKGEKVVNMNEINGIILVNEIEYIIQKEYPESIIPILSMFIDDGINKMFDDNDEVILYMNKIMKEKYYEYVDVLPKWRYYPENYYIMSEWLSDDKITMDELANKYEIDVGLLVKIIIKCYQIANELIENLNKLNKMDVYENIKEIREKIIREPLKLESLYIN